MAVHLPVPDIHDASGNFFDTEIDWEKWVQDVMLCESPSLSPVPDSGSPGDAAVPPKDILPVIEHGGYQHDTPQGSSNHVPRLRFSKADIAILSKHYRTSRNPRKAEIRELVRLVNATPKQVRKWFSNKRTRESKLRSRVPAPVPLTERSSFSLSGGDRASSGRQASASSSRIVTTPSETTPDYSTSSVGMKRKSESNPPLPKKKHHIDEHLLTPIPKITPDTIFQCTICCKEFSIQQNWQRHEETVCYSRRVWTCLADGWYTDEGEELLIASGSCRFCKLVNPPADHASLCKHRIRDCLSRPIEDRQFSRKDGLRSHCNEFHRFSPSDLLVDSWETGPLLGTSATVWDCGFCGMTTTDWAERVQHIARHFSCGSDMSSWLAAGQVQLRSLLIGGWSSESPTAKDLQLTYIEDLGIVAYTINWGLRKVALRFSVWDVAHIRPDSDELQPWKQEDEEAYIMELNVAPRFFFLTSDGREWQHCVDFTENRQASSYFVHTVIGLRNSNFTETMKKIDARRREPVQSLPVHDTILRAPMVVSSNAMSRYCPFCYQSFGNACGCLSHSMCTACPDCEKRLHREHNCTDPESFAFGSMFTCRGNLQDGSVWGCGAKFGSYMMLWLHITVDPAGATCRRAIVEEQDRNMEGEDLADMFSAGLRLSKAELGTDGDAECGSRPSTVLTL